MTQRARVEWVDAARGLAIIGVVVYHTGLFLGPVGWAAGWPRVMAALETFRMPVFFFASGLFAGKILTQRFADLWARRLSLFLYLYVLWSIVRWVFFQFVPFTLDPSSGDPSSWVELVAIFVWPRGGLWFIYALTIFSTFVWLTRRAHAWIPICISIVVSFLFTSSILDTGNGAWNKTGAYFAFFVCAIYVRDAALRLADRLSTFAAVLATGLYLLLDLVYLTIMRDLPGARLLVSAMGVVSGIALSTLVVRCGPWLGWVTFLGTRTLPIYLVHYLPVAAIAALLSPVNVPGEAGWVAVPVVAVVAICVSLLLDHALRGVHGVFDLPRKRDAITTASGPVR